MTDTAATELIHAQVPLCATLGITADTFRPDEVVLSLDWTPTLCTGNNVLHGGIIMALADSAGGVCAFLNLPEGAGGTATIESKTNFLRPLTMRAGTARGGGTPPRRCAAGGTPTRLRGRDGPSGPATRGGTVKAHSRPLHVGKRVIVLETEVRGDDGKLAAKVLQTQAIL
jgi:1,4-dihydroxy-2-naphthoyl-CoA hydrolase